MKALALDSSAVDLQVAAKNGEKITTFSFDATLLQEEKLLPAINFVLKDAALDCADLDFCAVCAGPGGWTSLRLAYSALKAISLAHSVPIYAVPTLRMVCAPFSDCEKIIVPVCDAKNQRFFCALYDFFAQKFDSDFTLYQKICSAEKIPAFDTDANEFFLQLKNFYGEKIFEKKFLLVGRSAKDFFESLQNLSVAKNLNFSLFGARFFTTDFLFQLAQDLILQNAAPLKDYDAPLYIRKSEAEIALEKKLNSL